MKGSQNTKSRLLWPNCAICC